MGAIELRDALSLTLRMDHDASGGALMIDLTNRLASVLDLLPVAVGLASAQGRYLAKLGGRSGMLGDMVPSRDMRKTSRWIITDATGTIVPTSEWPDARALRGDLSCGAVVGCYRDEDGDHPIKETSVATRDPTGPVAAVTFLQVFDTRSRSIEGNHLDLQQRLMDGLAEAVARGWSGATLLRSAHHRRG